MNKAIILGRLGKDPELKYTSSGVAVANFSVATSEKWKDKEGNKQEKTEWHNIVAWEKKAEIVGEYVKKGDMILVEGKIETRKWEKDGITRYSTEIIASSIELLGSKKNDAPKDEAPTQETVKESDLPF